MKIVRSMFTGVICLSFGVFLMISCGKIDHTPVPMVASLDVVIQGSKYGNVVRYGLSAYSYSNYEIYSAKVTVPGTNGQVYQLTATSDLHHYTYIPQTNELSYELPVKGNYTYEVVSVENEKVTGTDVLGDEILDPIVINAATMNNGSLKITWDKVEGAESYIVHLYSEDKETVLFSSSFIASDKVQYEFDSGTSGWATGISPAVNTNYVVELLGVKFETGITTDKDSNIQFITVDSKTIKWQ
jgi:hypothetical protein